MQGLISLDFGNTHPHAGFFKKENGTWSLTKIAPLEKLQATLTDLQMSAHNSSVVVCEVKPREDVLQNLQEQGFLVTRVKDYWRGTRFAGMPVQYAKTLGEDRLIEAFYAFKKIKAPTLLVDAGTFVTMDIITEHGFAGGYIIPGINSYFECFQKGELLKGVPLYEEYSAALPQETDKAMAGSYYAFVALAHQLITQHNIKNVLITGGQTSLWLNFFKGTTHPVVVESNPHLIHLALHYWMTTQIEPL